MFWPFTLECRGTRSSCLCWFRISVRVVGEASLRQRIVHLAGVRPLTVEAVIVTRCVVINQQLASETAHGGLHGKTVLSRPRVRPEQLPLMMHLIRSFHEFRFVIATVEAKINMRLR